MTEPITFSGAESHPFFHEWYLHGDFVDQKKGTRIITVQREERCQHCPTQRITIINCVRWEVVRRRYKYVKGYEIVRLGKDVWTYNEFLRTTDLSKTEKDRLGVYPRRLRAVAS